MIIVIVVIIVVQHTSLNTVHRILLIEAVQIQVQVTWNIRSIIIKSFNILRAVSIARIVTVLRF